MQELKVLLERTVLAGQRELKVIRELKVQQVLKEPKE
jgi:hypothetical protein